MKRFAQSMVIVLAALYSSPSLAVNDYVLVNPHDLSNLVTIEMSGDNNRLMIDQVAPLGQPGNAISVSLVGNDNGGPVGSHFRTLDANGLMPGSLIQHGFGNAIEVAVSGSDNLFAIAQYGSSNTARAQITGTENQFVIHQAGNGNFANLVQNGIGNTAIVTQIAW